MDVPAWLEKVLIREGGKSDLSALEWEGEYTHFRRLFQQVYERTLEGSAVIWLAEIPSEELIGQLFVQYASGRYDLADGSTRGYIYGFRIKPPYRNSGLGTRMLQTAELDMKEKQFCWAILNVARDNRNALTFYQKRGYQVVGAEPGNWSYIDHLGKKREVHEPAWRMRKRIC